MSKLDAIHKVVMTIVSIGFIVVAIMFLTTYRRDLQSQGLLQEISQSDADEFKKTFGSDPQQTTEEGRKRVQKQVTHETKRLWCIYFSSRAQGWKELTKDEFREAARAMSLAVKYGYTPYTFSQTFLQEDPRQDCPAPYGP